MNNLVLFTEQEIQSRVKEIATQISLISKLNSRNNKPIVLVCVLKGGFMFFADLVKSLTVDCELMFITAKSYMGMKPDEVSILSGITEDLTGKDIYIVDDILDSGNTVKTISSHLLKAGALTTTPVTLFKRKGSTFENLIYGFELNQEHWIRGYGLDGLDGTKRNLKWVEGAIFED